MWLYFLLVLVNLNEFAQCLPFEWLLANTTVWLSATAYCNTTDYLTSNYTGVAKGFIPYAVIDTRARDVQVG